MFTKTVTRLLLIVTTFAIVMCKPKPTNEESNAQPLKISLAQWSIHRSIQEGKLKAEDFASIAKNDFGISAIEYVNQFYKDHAEDEAFWKSMRAKADSLGVKSLLIMVDDEGDLGNPDSVARKTAVENHFKWVKVAKILGCHSIRINAFGEGSKEEVKAAMINALKQLCSYAIKDSINVLIENHGLYSSDGKWIAEVIQKVGLPNCGTLPDFGNWCTAEKWGSTEPGKDCKEVYDRYQGVSEMLPFAKGVSAKSYTFDSNSGDENTIDYSRMLKLVKEEKNFSGYVGVEYEGSPLSEPDGIRATKTLLEKTWKEINK